MLKSFKDRANRFSLDSKKPSCSICNDFRKPTFKDRSVRSRGDIAPPIEYEDILKGCQQSCPGCGLLRDIIAYYMPIGDKKTVWVSLVPPSAYSSQYQLQINGIGSLEIFATESK
jgi:hypothetical protein